MLEIKPATVTINDKEYVLELGKVKDTHIGMEDHGIFSVNVNFEFGGSVQGTGHYGTGENGEFLGVFVKNFLKLFGDYTTWEDLRGKSVFVLREENNRFGMIRGFVSQDLTKHMIIRDVFDEFEKDQS